MRLNNENFNLRSSRRKAFCKKGALKNVTKFTGEQLCWSLQLIKKETSTQVLSCEFCEFLKNTFLYRTPSVAASSILRMTLFRMDIYYPALTHFMPLIYLITLRNTQKTRGFPFSELKKETSIVKWVKKKRMRFIWSLRGFIFNDLIDIILIERFAELYSVPLLAIIYKPWYIQSVDCLIRKSYEHHLSAKFRDLSYWNL